MSERPRRLNAEPSAEWLQNQRLNGIISDFFDEHPQGQEIEQLAVMILAHSRDIGRLGPKGHIKEKTQETEETLIHKASFYFAIGQTRAYEKKPISPAQFGIQFKEAYDGYSQRLTEEIAGVKGKLRVGQKRKTKP